MKKESFDQLKSKHDDKMSTKTIFRFIRLMFVFNIDYVSYVPTSKCVELINNIFLKSKNITFPYIRHKLRHGNFFKSVISQLIYRNNRLNSANHLFDKFPCYCC